MDKQTVVWSIKRATGGISDGSRQGYKDSYRYGEFIDKNTDPDSFGVLNSTTLDSDANVIDFIKWIEPNDFGVFALGDKGNIYKRNAGNSYSVVALNSFSTGTGLATFNGSLFYASEANLGTSGQLANPTYNDNYKSLEPAAYHPLKSFINLLCVGNGRYLATLDDSTVWTNSRLSFRPDETVRCLELWNNYIAIGTQIGPSISTTPRGNVYLWDGTATDPNVIVPFSGAINALVNDNGTLMVFVGDQADIYSYNGGLPLKVKQLPLLGTGSVGIYPGAVGTWNNQVRFGARGGNSNTTPKGIYTFGSKSKDYPKVLSFDYALSTGEKNGSTVSIGAFSQLSSSQAIFSWKNNTTSGVDRITTEAIATEAKYQSLVFDNQRPFLRRKPTVIRVTLDSPLATGEYVNVYLRKEGQTNFTKVGATSSSDQNKSSFTYQVTLDVDTNLLFDSKGCQHEFQMIWGGTGATRPTISSATVLFEEDVDVYVMNT